MQPRENSAGVRADLNIGNIMIIVPESEGEWSADLPVSLDFCVFEKIVTCLDHYRSHLNCIGLPESSPDKKQKCINLYVKVFKSLNTYILEATNQELSKIEHFLMKTILMPDDLSKFWSVNLAADLWYSLARLVSLLCSYCTQPDLESP